MISPTGERAISDALTTGNAILKFISRNDVGLTKSHQYGYYLPKAIWEMFTKQPPESDVKDRAPAKVVWQDGRITDSHVIWYGQKSRREYRLTGFGKDFPFRTHDNLGDMLVLIPKNEERNRFHAYVLDHDEDISEIQAALGVETRESWAAYRAGYEPPAETMDACIDRHFRAFMKPLTKFPTTKVFSEQARKALTDCMKAAFLGLTPDKRLMECVENEYMLFRMVERQLCQKEIQRLFKDVDDFLSTAQSITNRRKARAGRALENHVGWLLKNANVPFEPRVKIDGKVEPDILIPSKEAYEDLGYPVERLCVMGVKTTCKDRWRQVLSEGKRIPQKHILTLQPGISKNQLTEMRESNVTLVVPKALHKEYPKGTGIQLLTVEQFIDGVQLQLAGKAPTSLFS